MPLATLLEALAILIVALAAPACLVVRVERFDARQMASMQRVLKAMKARGLYLRYADEDDDTVRRRFERLARIAEDPVGRMQHLLRRAHDPLARARFAMFAPPSEAPPVLQIAALADARVAVAAPDSS